MSEHSEFLAEAGMMEWEREVRGYNRQQVDNFVAMRNGQIRELENRLSQTLGEIDRLRHELTEAREAGGRPAHQEISERVGQILKLAADEAKAERERGAMEIGELRETATAETDKLRADTKLETDRLRAEAQDRAERMLAAAQDQSERSVAVARAEADELMGNAHSTAEQMVADASKHADSTVAAAIAQAKQQLDDATSRATAIHDGAERRLNLLISRHTETVRRLTEIRDVVTSLVSGETARGSLEDEVGRMLSAQTAANGNGGKGPDDAAQAGAHRAQRPAGPADARRPGVGQPTVPPEGQPEQQAGQAGRRAAAVPGTLVASADPLTAERRDGGQYPAAVDTTKRQDRELDETATGGHSVDD